MQETMRPGVATALDEQDRARLLRLARQAVASAAEGREPPAALAEDGEAPSGVLSAPAGAFVTLYREGALRGCVGTFDTSRPLWEVVRSMGAASATRDARFPPVRPEEVDGLSISISVLTPPRPVRSLDEIEPSRHGLLVTRGPRRGVLLNKVARERAWDRDAFLTATCTKAGLQPTAWQRFGAPGEGLDVSVFEELDFGEP